ncbi:MAG: restriction endonuclease subunit S, partial [Moraxella sp.]
SNEDKKRLNSYILKEGDLAFSRVGSVDRCAIITNNEEGWLFSGRILRVRPNKSIIEPKFLMYVLKTEETKFRIRSVAVGQTMPSLNTEILKNFSVDISNNRQEQTKIAEFLSAVDDKISQLSRQLELLNEYKKGVMQKIFSQEIRFKNDNGDDFGEWEEVLLNSVCDVRDGTHDSPKYVKEGYPLVTSKNLKDGKLDLTDISLISQTDFDNINKRSKVHAGDIIFGMIGTIGNPVLLKESNFAIKNVALIKERNELLNKFLIHFLNSSLFDRQVKVLNAGNTQKFLSLNQIRNLSVPKPTIQEQEKIAEFLTAIDEQIDHTTAQLTHTKQWKKGLLQQMFV